jgi:uncharacterized protein
VPARLIVIAKAPRPGHSKTRLCPPCSPRQAAALAEAALSDTLRAVAAAECGERVLHLEGEPGAWLPDGFTVLPQVGGGLDRRLAAAFAAHQGPTLLIGMDTPQVTPALLEDSLAALLAPGTDAVLGAAVDGGYWAIGLRRPDPRAFDGVPMSSERTGERQLARLRELGLRTAELPPLRDVDRIEDAEAVAAECPGSEFARTLGTLRSAPARTQSVGPAEENRVRAGVVDG